MIEQRRSRALSKISYYKNLKRVVKAWSPNPEVQQLRSSMEGLGPWCGADQKQENKQKLDNLLSNIRYTRERHPKPTKWMGRMHDLNKKVLFHQMEYVKAKYDAARHTTKTRKRVKFLLEKLDATLRYRNGAILFIARGEHPERDITDQTLIASMAKEYDGIVAVESMLKGKYDQKKS
jgi:hypothetical protein